MNPYAFARVRWAISILLLIALRDRSSKNQSRSSTSAGGNPDESH